MRYMPLLVTVGNALAFPYYIVWLKTVSLTFPMFAWLFAIHSFAAALGYSICMKKSAKRTFWLYLIMAGIYTIVGLSASIQADMMYVAIGIQIILGFVQGYFRAWHVAQPLYKIHAVSNYLLVGFAMLGLSFIHFITPQFILLLFGILLGVCSVYALFAERKKEEKGDDLHSL